MFTLTRKFLNKELIQNTSKAIACVSVILFVASCGGGGGRSDVGEQDDDAPIAIATVIGAGQLDDGTYLVRSGSDILLSGKDSEGFDDPILGFSWQGEWQSGAPFLTASDLDELLTERSNNSKLLTLPIVEVESRVDFQLTVTDSDGETATDTVSLLIQPVQDLDSFLTQLAVKDTKTNSVEMVLSLDLNGGLTNSQVEVQIDTIAQWKPRAPQDDWCVWARQ